MSNFSDADKTNITENAKEQNCTGGNGYPSNKHRVICTLSVIILVSASLACGTASICLYKRVKQLESTVETVVTRAGKVIKLHESRIEDHSNSLMRQQNAMADSSLELKLYRSRNQAQILDLQKQIREQKRDLEKQILEQKWDWEKQIQKQKLDLEKQILEQKWDWKKQVRELQKHIVDLRKHIVDLRKETGNLRKQIWEQQDRTSKLIDATLKACPKKTQ